MMDHRNRRGSPGWRPFLSVYAHLGERTGARRPILLDYSGSGRSVRFFEQNHRSWSNLGRRCTIFRTKPSAHEAIWVGFVRFFEQNHRRL